MNTGSINKALIEAILYIATVEGSDDREDDDVRVLESVIAELAQTPSSELEAFLSVVKETLENTQDPTRIDALESILEALA